MIEVETQTIEVEVVTNTEVTSTGQVEVETVDLSDLDITVAKKEYVITGDDIYIPMLYDDAPQWMKDLVQVVVDVSISSGNQSLINNMNAILQDFAVSYVPLNQYTQSIIDLSDEDTRLNGLIETLNSNFNDGLSNANAQIISLQLTKASKDEVVAQVIQTIAAQLADGTSNIGSVIGRIDQAIANETSARALSLQTLTASLEDTNLDVTANAEVIQNALAYVGIDEAGASTGTGLSAYLEDSNGNIGGADSQLANSIRVTAEGVESKFAYNSIVNINGVYKKSGFGLTTNYTSGNGTQANPYVSEFWIDASRLKFTNSNQTGQTAPFTIDASGANPQITFNGKVAFTNVTGYTPPDVSGTINANNDVFAQKLGYTNYASMVSAASNGQSIITGGYLRTSLIQADQIIAGGILANSVLGNTISGSTITGSKIYGAQIEGSIIKASFIDLTSTATLTNWQQYTPANYPSQYAANFAHKNDGTLLVDNLGYVRLIGNTNIVTQQIIYNNNYVSRGTTFPLTLPTYSVDFYAYSDYKSSTLNRCITSTPTLNIASSQKIVFCDLSTDIGNGTTGTTSVNCYINGDYYEVFATGTLASDSLSYTFSCSIKKNSILINKTSSISGINITAYIGDLPISISVGATGYYGLYPKITIATTNVLSSSTTINYSDVYGKAFELTYAYSSRRYYSSINVPSITING